MLLRFHSLGGGGRAFPRSRQFQSCERGQRGQGCAAPGGLDFLLMFCGGKAADCIAAVTMTTRWAIRAPFGIKCTQLRQWCDAAHELCAWTACYPATSATGESAYIAVQQQKGGTGNALDRRP